MATVAPLVPGEVQFFDNSGNPLAAGLLYTYVPASTTPKNTWQDENQAALNANPITLDANGRAVIFGTGLYRLQLYDSLGNLMWDADGGASDTAYIVTQIPAFVGDSGAGGVAGFVPAPPAGSTANGYYLSADGAWGPLNVVVPATPGPTQAGKLFVPVRQVNTTATSLLLTDAGGAVTYANAGAGTLTVTNDATAAWVLGVMTQIMLYSFSTSGNLSVTPDTGVTLFWPGSSASSATRTLAANGQCVLTRIGANFWTIIGGGIS